MTQKETLTLLKGIQIKKPAPRRERHLSTTVHNYYKCGRQKSSTAWFLNFLLCTIVSGWSSRNLLYPEPVNFLFSLKLQTPAPLLLCPKWHIKP